MPDINDIINDIINTLTGSDKVETTGTVRRSWFSDQDVPHIHAKSAHRDALGNYTVTEQYTGAKFEIPRDQIKSIGGAVETERDTF